jgi:uncharacterized protein YutE (UPF0331/DUF86 family)
VDKRLIQEKLESLRRCVTRVAEKCPDTADRLASDADLQDIVAINLTRAVQLCVDIASHILSERDSPAPETMGDAFDRLAALELLEPALAQRLRKAVGFRNIAVHNYTAIDWQVVHRVCKDRLADFRDFAAAVSSLL